MGNVHSANEPVSYQDPQVFRYTTEYFIRLLVQRHAIRAALENPGGSVILTGSTASTEQTAHFSSVLGNDLHCDLLDAEAIVMSLPDQQRKTLLDWIDGMTSQESAYYQQVKPDAIRKRRQRAIETAGEQWAHRHDKEVENA